ncbi:MAG: transporter permease subunit [Acidobacteriota bacterium]|nr:transporter permease subunit [Acidobacteriota bacterium]
MRTFKTFFIFEFKRFFGRRNVIIIVLLLLFSLVFIQNGINDYKNLLDHKDKFQEFERTKTTQYINYVQYGIYGIRMLFVPAPISIFFINSSVIPDMTAYVDSGEQLKIYKPLKGKNIFELNKFGFADFSGILLFFGSLLALFYGYETFNSNEYLKFLTSISSRKQVFFSMIFSRIIMMILLFLFLLLSAMLMITLNELYVPIDRFLASFALVIFLLLLFCFSVGTIIGTLQSKIMGITALLSCWFVLLYFIPTAVNAYIVDKSDLITPIQKLEMDKLKILMDFEKRSIDNLGISKYGQQDEAERQNILSYFDNDFKKIQALEETIQTQTEANISLLQRISMFFPSTFYLSVTNELSSRGYDNLIDFHKYVQALKRDFVKFYIYKVYFSNFTTVESFVKKDENIFPGRSWLPVNFAAGILVNLFYVIGLFVGSYTRFRRSLFMLPENETPGSYPRNLKLKKSEFKVLVSEGDLFKNQLFNLFSGETGEFKKKGFAGEVLIDGVDITTEKSRASFLYLCHPENIPGDIRVPDFLSFIRSLLKVKTDNKKNEPKMKSIGWKKFSRLKTHERGEIMLVVLGLKAQQIYLVDDIARGMPIEFTVQLKQKLTALKEEEALVLYLTPDELINLKSIKKGQKFYESTTWCQLVDHYKGLLDIC